MGLSWKALSTNSPGKFVRSCETSLSKHYLFKLNCTTILENDLGECVGLRYVKRSRKQYQNIICAIPLNKYRRKSAPVCILGQSSLILESDDGRLSREIVLGCFLGKLSCNMSPELFSWETIRKYVQHYGNFLRTSLEELVWNISSVNSLEKLPPPFSWELAWTMVLGR